MCKGGSVKSSHRTLNTGEDNTSSLGGGPHNPGAYLSGPRWYPNKLLDTLLKEHNTCTNCGVTIASIGAFLIWLHPVVPQGAPGAPGNPGVA